MKGSFKILLGLVILFCCTSALAQASYSFKGQATKRIKFELIGNLIVIPIEVNGVTLSFILDTGVSKPILFNISEMDSVGLKNIKSFYLYGLGGDGRIEALKSTQNIFKIGNARLQNKDLYVVYDQSINFTPRLGVLIHGIIGYDIFKDFIVEINYSSKFIRLYKRQTFHRELTKWNRLDLELYNKKPYLKTSIVNGGNKIYVKLLIDTGSGDALWLFKNYEQGIEPNQDKVFNDFLGKGLSGSIYGLRSKIEVFNFGTYRFENANVAYPDSMSIDTSMIYKGRNGSLGGDILKRFNYYIDYQGGQIFFRRNKNFKDPFTYNNSGIVIEHNGIMFVKESIQLKSQQRSTEYSTVRIDPVVRYITRIQPVYQIVEVRPTSNAYKKGIRKGDVLIAVNNRLAYEYNLEDINKIFHDRTGKTIRLRIKRNGTEMVFKFELDDVFER